MGELNIKIDMDCNMLEDTTYIKESIERSLKDYFFTDDFKKSLFSAVLKDFVLTTFSAELKVKCREIVQKMTFSDVFGYSCSNEVAKETIVEYLTQEKDNIKIKLLSLLDTCGESTVEKALVEYIENHVKNKIEFNMQVRSK